MPTPIAAEIRPLTNTRRNRRRITPSVARFLLRGTRRTDTFCSLQPNKEVPAAPYMEVHFEQLTVDWLENVA